MQINSVQFLLFFAVVFFLYYICQKSAARQNIVLLVASYTFYAFADVRMLPLLAGITIAFFVLGLLIEKYEDKKAADYLLVLGLILGVGILLYYKYTNFFLQGFASLLRALGFGVYIRLFSIVMPLGISFFVFRLLSYLIEIHRGTIAASRNIVTFASFVAFFPCMVSGPIDRPNVFLPQLEKARTFSRALATDGMRQVLWGLFKKVAIADTLYKYLDFSGQGATIIVSAIILTFQIYADFSGYSDMAIGLGKILGIKVARNFRYPFFAMNIADFWRRWHISLTSWATDYIYTPLSFSVRKLGVFGSSLSIIITFLVIGLWHGASMSNVVYGFYHGLLFVPLLLSGSFSAVKEIRLSRIGLPVPGDFVKIVVTFLLVAFGMMIFNSESPQAFWGTLANIPINFFEVNFPNGIGTAVLLISALTVFEWIQRDKEYALEVSGIHSRVVRWALYSLILFLLFALGGTPTPYVYQVF